MTQQHHQRPTQANAHPRWDDFVRQHARGNLLQLSGWGRLKSEFGWSALPVILTDGGQIVAGAQLLFRALPLRLGTMAYLPFGPYSSDPKWDAALWDAIHTAARRQRAAFLKWEPGIYLDQPMPDFAALGFAPALQTIQPPNTILIDISVSDDALLGAMNQGTRRNIRKSLANEIRYFQAELADFDQFVQIMQVTGERNEFGVHAAAYYRRMVELFVPQDGALILAEHEGDTLAANFVFSVNDTAVYLVGASANEKRNLMASYGVQWHGIKWAQQRGCRLYDLWGIPDEDEATLEAQFQERSDGLWGVYRFKRGWGGKITRSVGAWDHVYNPLIYTAYRTALRLRSSKAQRD
jgi:lipid II:glycine glycyltransferase (peptidoglycan interpeptide bridge formation enzyme)